MDPNPRGFEPHTQHSFFFGQIPQILFNVMSTVPELLCLLLQAATGLCYLGYRLCGVCCRVLKMAIRAMYENSSDIGVFSLLTNSYALLAMGGSTNFYSVFEAELADHIPVVHASIAGIRPIGRLCVGILICLCTLLQVLRPMRRQQAWSDGAQHHHRSRTTAFKECSPRECSSTTC